MNLVTILTPTYNRGYKIGKLFETLQNMEEGFEWLIIDDGSMDDTEEIVGKFKDNANFKIEYLKKSNGGKHTAINFGMKYVSTPLTMIVDSDDILLPNAITEIKKVYQKYHQKSEVASYVFLRCHPNGNPIVSLERDEFVANYIDYRIKGNRPGDMAEVFLTRALKENPFPVFEGEKFLSEDVCWIEIGKKYNSVFINRAIYQSEYLKNGLTDSDKKIKFNAPNGSMLRGFELMSNECGFIVNLKGAIIYDCYKKETDNCLVYPDTLRKKIMVILMKPLGSFYNKKWKKSIR